MATTTTRPKTSPIVRIDQLVDEIVHIGSYDFSRAEIHTVIQMVVKLNPKAEPTPDELGQFLYVARTRRLNPLLGQIHMIFRYNSKAGREVPTFQVSVDGFRAIADRSGKYAPGSKPTMFDYGDPPLYIQGKAGIQKLVPYSATVHVVKYVQGNPHEYGVPAVFDEYAQRYDNSGDLMGLWATHPHVMIAKCSETAGLRRGWPEDLSGLYVPEEMGNASIMDPDLDYDRAEYDLTKGTPAAPSATQHVVVEMPGASYEPVEDSGPPATDQEFAELGRLGRLLRWSPTQIDEFIQEHAGTLLPNRQQVLDLIKKARAIYEENTRKIAAAPPSREQAEAAVGTRTYRPGDMTQRQEKAIEALCQERGLDADDFIEDRLGETTTRYSVTEEQAKQLIAKLNQMPRVAKADKPAVAAPVSAPADKTPDITKVRNWSLDQSHKDFPLTLPDDPTLDGYADAVAFVGPLWEKVIPQVRQAASPPLCDYTTSVTLPAHFYALVDEDQKPTLRRLIQVLIAGKLKFAAADATQSEAWLMPEAIADYLTEWLTPDKRPHLIAAIGCLYGAWREQNAQALLDLDIAEGRATADVDLESDELFDPADEPQRVYSVWAAQFALDGDAREIIGITGPADLDSLLPQALCHMVNVGAITPKESVDNLTAVDIYARMKTDKKVTELIWNAVEHGLEYTPPAATMQH